MTLQISDKINVEIAQNLNVSLAVFLPLSGVRLSSFDIRCSNINKSNIRNHNWSETAQNAGKRSIFIAIEGYFQATDGEELLQQAAISGDALLVKIISNNDVLLITPMQLSRFVRLQNIGLVENFKAELQNINLVDFQL
jgi:hypothetical protein